MVSKILQDEIKNMQKLTPKFQFVVISYLNTIEIGLTEILSVDICKKPQDLKQRTKFFKFFDDMTLERKIELVSIVLENHYPSILKSNPDYIAELHELRNIRNKIAHNYVQYEHDGKSKVWLTLAHPIIKKSSERLTRKKVESYIKKSFKISKQTTKIHKFIGNLNQLMF